jgi:hypothetical protein
VSPIARFAARAIQSFFSTDPSVYRDFDWRSKRLASSRFSRSWAEEVRGHSRRASTRLRGDAPCSL